MTYLQFDYNEKDPIRLDLLVHQHLKQNSTFSNITRSQVKLWIEAGAVKVNGKALTKAGSLVSKGAKIALEYPSASSSTLSAYDFALKVVYEDRDILVIDKPPGISVHPGAGNVTNTLANAIVHHLKAKDIDSEFVSSGERPGIVHRLDKDTTGLLVVAKNVSAHSKLSAQFKSRSAKRRYYALVFCTPRATRVVRKQDSGVIETKLGRHPKRRTLFAVMNKGGKTAVTRWKVIERMSYACLLEIELDTGRTHQIRVHMQHIGTPVIGDKDYGDFSAMPKALRRAADDFGRQALHAFELTLTHPETKKLMKFNSELPADCKELIKKFR